jgi:uncharacterized protein YqgC (DUF456 family)
MTTLLWLLAVVLILVGLIGTLLPVLPGAVLIFVGMMVAAWADGFSRVGIGTLTFLAILTALVYVVDFVAGAAGARQLGATRWGMWGALVGAVIGLFFGLAGVLIGPFIGAFLGEYWSRRRLSEAGRAGVGAWIGLALGTAARLALVFAMLGVFMTALLL